MHRARDTARASGKGRESTVSNLLDLVKKSQERVNLPAMHPGDTVRVHARIVEGNKERVQIFEGVIIRFRRGQNASSITVRRIANTIGVERTFMIHSPRIDRFEVVRRGRVRRAKLYYLRDRQGKSARIRELRPAQQVRVARTEAVAPAPIETGSVVEMQETAPTVEAEGAVETTATGAEAETTTPQA